MMMMMMVMRRKAQAFAVYIHRISYIYFFWTYIYIWNSFFIQKTLHPFFKKQKLWNFQEALYLVGCATIQRSQTVLHGKVFYMGVSTLKTYYFVDYIGGSTWPFSCSSWRTPHGSPQGSQMVNNRFFHFYQVPNQYIIPYYSICIPVFLQKLQFLSGATI